MTWKDFLSSIRNDLQDTAVTPRWSDDLIYLYAKDALWDYSLWFPRRLIEELTLTDGGYPLPALFIDVVHVESPRSRFLEKRHETPGRRYFVRGRPTLYFVEGGILFLNGTPLDNDEVVLTYLGAHPAPEDAEDEDFELTVADRDLEIVRLYVIAKINMQMRGKQSRLDRFEPGAGRRDDNPLTPEGIQLMEEYYSKINDRLGGKTVQLYRVGKTR